MAKLSVSELLRRACLYAEQDRESWLVAHDNCLDDPFFSKLIREETAYLEQLRAYRINRWGTPPLMQKIEQAKSVPIAEVIKRFHDEPNPQEPGDERREVS